MINLDQAKIDPTSVFHRPKDVLKEKTLSREQKIDILKRWEYDERGLAVAEAENMQSANGNRHSNLDEVLACLRELDAEKNGIRGAGAQHD
jgi:hypothetical protein